jgi:hypothetical protein
VQFTVGRQPISLEHQDVIDRLKGKTPPVHGRQKHFVAVGRKQWPVKAALAESAGLDPVTFPTSEAVRVLTRLGFPVVRTES